MGLRMLLLLHALIPCLGAYNILPSSSVLLHINIVPSFPVLLHIYTTLVSLLFGTVIPTSFNILMEMLLLPCFTVFLLYRNSRMPYYVSIKPYNSTVQEFCAVQLRLYGRVGPSHFHSQYERWRAEILRKKPSRLWEQSRSTPVMQTEVTLTDLLHTYAVAS